MNGGTAERPDRLEVGRIGRAHGLRGEVAVHLTTDRTERVAVGARLDAGDRSLVVADARPHKTHWLVRFDGVHDRGGAEALTGLVLWAEPIDDPDTIWVDQLVGKPVRTLDGTAVGEVVALVANPASDLLELDDGSLVPLRFVTDVGDEIRIDPPAGLLDL